MSDIDEVYEKIYEHIESLENATSESVHDLIYQIEYLINLADDCFIFEGVCVDTGSEVDYCKYCHVEVDHRDSERFATLSSVIDEYNETHETNINY